MDTHIYPISRNPHLVRVVEDVHIVEDINRLGCRPGKGMGGTEFLGTVENIFLYRGPLTLSRTGPNFFAIRDFYILPLMVCTKAYRLTFPILPNRCLGFSYVLGWILRGIWVWVRFGYGW